MNVKEFYDTYTSDCAAGCGNQLLTRLEAPVTKTGRCWFRLSHGGENYALLFSNQIDSTYDDGSISCANDVGGENWGKASRGCECLEPGHWLCPGK